MAVILTTISATLLIQLGYFLWKVSADGQPKIGTAPGLVVAKALISDWRWTLGFLSTSAGWVLFVQATALGDISLVQPLMSAGDLLLVILAVVFLNERLVTVEWLGVVLTVFGAVALSADAGESAMTGYAGHRLLGLIAVLLIAVIALLLGIRRSGRPEILLALVVGMCFGAGSILTKALTNGYSDPGHMVATWAILIDPLLLAVVAANVAGLVLLQAAFQRGRAAVIVPIQLALANAVTVIAGVAIFAEHITNLRAIGILLILGGTALLHLKPHRST